VSRLLGVKTQKATRRKTVQNRTKGKGDRGHYKENWKARCVGSGDKNEFDLLQGAGSEKISAGYKQK